MPRAARKTPRRAKFAGDPASRAGAAQERSLHPHPGMKGSLALSLLVVAGASCATRPLVRDDDMSAAQHRSAAAQAAEAPTDESREHARQHAAAAAFLEQFEDDACGGVPPSERAASPLLGPLLGLEDIPGGVRATFADASRVHDAIAEMRCHYAFARARHFSESVGCPLYVQGIEIRRGLDPRSVEIVARVEATVRLIRERSRAQAIVVRRGR